MASRPGTKHYQDVTINGTQYYRRLGTQDLFTRSDDKKHYTPAKMALPKSASVSEIEDSDDDASDSDSEIDEQPATKKPRRAPIAMPKRTPDGKFIAGTLPRTPPPILADFITQLMDNLTAENIKSADVYWLLAGKASPSMALTCYTTAADLGNVDAMQLVADMSAANGDHVVAKKWRDRIVDVTLGPKLGANKASAALRKFMSTRVLANPQPTDRCMMCNTSAADALISRELYHFTCVTHKCCITCLRTHICLDNHDFCPECAEPFDAQFQDMFSNTR